MGEVLMKEKRMINDEEMEEIMKKEILPLTYHCVNPKQKRSK